MAESFAAFSQRLDVLAHDLAGKQMLEAVGKAAKNDVDDAVHATLGDDSMSNWRRGHPIPIQGRWQVVGDSVQITPAPRGRGPFRVLEDGRQGGGSHDLVLVGKVRKDGTRRARSRGRTQGATSEGKVKHTWTHAEALILRRTPSRAGVEFQKAIKRAF